MADATDAERWLPIPGYEGHYDVSDCGQVRSWRPWNGKPVPRLLRQAEVRGYRQVGLSVNGVLDQQKVHRLVLLAFVGECPSGMEVRHLDGDRAHNRLPNLRYGTKSQNAVDRVRHGTDAHASVTHCPRGHPYDDRNTGWKQDSARYCPDVQPSAEQALEDG